MNYDVIIVGGGLAGSALAIQLAPRGYRVLVLERETRFKDRIRGELLMPWGVADAVAALFSEDAVCEDVALGVINHGRAQIRAFAQGAFAANPDFHIELINSSLKGGHGTVEWKFSGTDADLYKTGKAFNSIRATRIIGTWRPCCASLGYCLPVCNRSGLGVQSL